MSTLTTNVQSAPGAPAAPPAYTRLAALGFALIALGAAIYILLGLLGGEAGSWPYVLPFVIVGLLVAGALWRFGVWAQILGAVLALLLLLLVVPFTTFEMTHPESARDFLPVWFIIAGAAFGFVGSAVGLVQRRQHTLRTSSTPAESLAVKGILALLAVAALMSLAFTAMSRTTVSEASRAGAISVNLKDMHFTPNHIEAKTGQAVRLVVRNDDATLHTFTLSAAAVDFAVPPGAERLIEFKAPAAGTYRWYCIPHSDSGTGERTGMVGTLSVE